MSYEKYYPGGWKSGETGGTPITPEALNHMEDGIETANENLLPAPQNVDDATFLRNDNTWQKVTPANIGAVPTSRTVNGKALSSNVTLTASDITSGTFGVARGGTGRSTLTANAVLTGNTTSAVNQIATASGALYATASNDAAKFGTLPIAQGGTGATTAAAACSNLGLSPAMNIGTEYTTHEKYKNKVVYVKAVSLDLAASGNKSVSVNSAMTEVVSFTAYAINQGIAYHPAFASLVSCYVNVSSGTFVINCAEKPNWTAYAIVKYIK